MNCIHCKTEFKARHKYHQFCSKLCKFRNFHSPERVITTKMFCGPRKKVINKDVFCWKEYPYGVLI